MDEGRTKQTVSAQRHIIERPRLTGMLDAANARIVLLTAPAGYGKTTLARQWFAKGDKKVAWYRATQASGDVAALAAGIAKSIGQIVSDAAEPVIRYVRATERPDDDAEAMAEMLAEALETWPSDAWLVIDDYQFMRNSPPAEQFVHSLAVHSPLRLCVISRKRPGWASARHVLYGEMFELDQHTLALSTSEAEVVLTATPRSYREEVVERARGWPAVVGLAALLHRRAVPPRSLPVELHDYFAEELFQTAAGGLQLDLLKLAALPTLTASLVNVILGERATETASQAIELGFLTKEIDGGYYLHPLLRAFLEAKIAEKPMDTRFLKNLVAVLVGEQRWDDAFIVISRFRLHESLPTLVEAAYDDLVDSNRLATLERWVEYAINEGIESAMLDLAEAEMARRRGQFQIGEARAVQAAATLERTDAARAAHAYVLAAGCAYHDMRADACLAHTVRALETASRPSDERRATWMRFLIACQFELGDPRAALDVVARLHDDKPSTRLRLATGRLTIATFEDTPLRQAATAESRHLPLVPRTDDAIPATGYLFRLAYAHLLAASYQEALRLLALADDTARETGLRFSAPHITGARVGAYLGAHQFKQARHQLDRLLDQLRETDAPFERANMRGLRARLALAKGDYAQAVSELERLESTPTPALRGEFAGLRALSEAALGASEKALSFASASVLGTRDVQAHTLAALVRAVVAIQNDDNSFETHVQTAAALLQARENFDSFVAAYRVCPPLLEVFHRSEALSHREIARIVRSARDVRLARDLRLPDFETPQREETLSRREREVYELLCQGLTNREIGHRLFISEVTVKVHVRHILRKLQARSRTEAVTRLYEDA